MPDDAMFSQLMAESERPPEPAKEERPPVERRTPPSANRVDDLLPDRLEDLGEAGYTSHSYRLTEAELKWLRRFALRLSEHTDRSISHNTLIRALLRLADEEWRKNPEKNRLFTILDRAQP